MSRCLAQRVDYRLVDAKQELQVAAQELVNAVDNKVFVDTLGEARYKQDVCSDRGAVLEKLQVTQCRLEVLCNVEHGNSFGRVWVYGEGSPGVQWSRAHEFIGNESQYAQSHFGQGYNEFAKNKARIEGLFGGFKAEYDRYQQAWAVVKQLEAESHS